MDDYYEKVVRAVADKGHMSVAEARRSVAACRSRMLLEGGAGYTAGAFIGIYFTLGLTTIPLAALGTGVGAGVAVFTSASCADVRDAHEYWLGIADVGEQH